MAATEPRRDSRYDADKRERAAAMYDEGMTVRQVAAKLDLSTRRAWELITSGGAQMRRAGRPKKEEAA